MYGGRGYKQQLRQLGDIRRDPSRLIAREQFGADHRRGSLVAGGDGHPFN
jgi:hypothetical protein